MLNSTGHLQAIQGLLREGRRLEACAAIEAASQLLGERLEDHELLGAIAFGMGLHEIAREQYAKVVASRPRDAIAWYNLAAGERAVGQLEAAETACDRSLALDSRTVQAALLRAELRKQQGDANHIDELRRWLSQATDERAVIQLNYALGKELDDVGEYAEAFCYFAAGAAVRRRRMEYDVGKDVRKLARICEVFDADRLRSAPSLQAPEHTFIVGLPRSGTTLIERMLTGNSDVATNGETGHLLDALTEGSRAETIDPFRRFAEANSERVRQAYARRAADPRARRLVLEKLPFNYLYAGAIRLTLPNARIVLLTRTPADNCLAMFTTLFQGAYPFSYDLVELGKYYVAFRALVEHWLRVMPDQILVVPYEQFIKEPVALGARIAAHAGIAWSEAMIRIEDNPSTSATASATQARRPIYRTAVGRWKHYAAQLAPLQSVLKSGAIDSETPWNPG